MKTKVLYPIKLTIPKIVFCLFLFINQTYSQNTLQKIKFEEAQELYDNNKFKEAVSILNQLEAEGLRNPRVLHLKILAQSNFDIKDLTSETFNDLKKNVNKYLKDYDIKGLEDKYKEVYEVSKKLKIIESNLVKNKADELFKNNEFDKALDLYMHSYEMGCRDLDLYISIIAVKEKLNDANSSNNKDIFLWKEKAADLGHLPSCVEMGHVYKEGKEISQDVTKAAQYFRKANGSNLPGANIGMAWVYFYEVDGEYDHKSIINHLEKEPKNSKYYTEANYFNAIIFWRLEGTWSTYKKIDNYIKTKSTSKEILESILQSCNPSTHNDYYIRERAALIYLNIFKPDKFIQENLAQDVYNSLKTGAEEFNSPLAQLYLHYIHKGIISINRENKTNFKFEANHTLAEKYLLDFKNNSQKTNIPYIQYLMALDLGKYINVKSINKEIYDLYDQSVGGGNFEATHIVKHFAQLYSNPEDVAILRKYNINY